MYHYSPPILCIFCNEEKYSEHFYYRRFLYNQCKPCSSTSKGATPAKKLWMYAKQRAYDKKLPFTITVEDVVIPAVCPIFNVPLHMCGRPRGINSPSLDRLDPKLGYIPENIAVISFRANTIKNNGTPGEHDRIAEWMRERHAQANETLEETIAV